MRIEPKPYRDYPWYVRILFWIQEKKHGAVFNSAKLWGRSPRVFFGLSTLYGAFTRKSSPISPSLRSLVSIHIAKIIRCSFCEDLNAALLVKGGGNQELVDELEHFASSGLIGEKEKAALRYAEAISHTPNKVADDLFSDLKKHFNEDEIIELTAWIAFQNCSSRFNTALKIPSQGFFNFLSVSEPK